VPIEELRETSLNKYCVHLDIVMEEKMEYSRGQIAAILQPNEYVNLIIDIVTNKT
jgi:hypothetical protein